MKILLVLFFILLGGVKAQSLPLKTAPIVGESNNCNKISAILGYDSKKTLKQKNEIWKKQYKGKKFTWNLQVIGTDEDASGYSINYTCLPLLSKPSIVVIKYPLSYKSQLLSVQIGSPYVVSMILNEFEIPPKKLSDKVTVRFKGTISP